MSTVNRDELLNHLTPTVAFLDLFLAGKYGDLSIEQVTRLVKVKENIMNVVATLK